MSTCRCDTFEHPPQLLIPAGLSELPRQIAGFPEFRRAMLGAIRRYPVLSNWRGRSVDDFGIMLLEMWAYVADVQAFYDQVLANESYVRTARQRSSLRRLTGLLGYVPKPAVAAAVPLAILAEGRLPIVLPKGLAFRSNAFDGEPPQVFELEAAATVHPLNNRWTLGAPAQTTLSATGGSTIQSFAQLLLSADADLRQGDLVLVSATGSRQVSTVGQVAAATTGVRQKVKQVTFSPPIALPGNTPPPAVELTKATQSGSLWKAPHVSGDPAVVGANAVVLDGLYRSIKPGQVVVLAMGGDRRWYQVVENIEITMTLSAAKTTTAKDADNKNVTIAVPPVTSLATRLVLDAAIDAAARRGANPAWGSGAPAKMALFYGFARTGAVVTAPKTTVASTDALLFSGTVETPAESQKISRLLLEDKNTLGCAVGGTVDYANGQIKLDQGVGWPVPLTPPVTVYGNVVTATRGETVPSEILGSGDASRASQSFVLKKAPLTYTAAPTADNEQGAASSLQVYVNNIRWREAPSFFGFGPQDQVYIVRQNDAGAAVVTFGDGQRGARLPTGANNVVASYRYGAGKVAPPAGGITQLARPVKGLTGVRSPVAAGGGSDAENPDQLRTYAPRSALLLGRAVSVDDMQVVAAGVPGVRAATAEWRWSKDKQRPVVQIWYIGDASASTTVSQRLRRVSDPTTPIAVAVATPIVLRLAIDVEIDTRYLDDVVLPQVRAVLMDGEHGLLAPARIGIGQPLFRSQVFAAALSVEGVIDVRGLAFEFGAVKWPWVAHVIKPPAGMYLDFAAGGVELNGKESDSG